MSYHSLTVHRYSAGAYFEASIEFIVTHFVTFPAQGSLHGKEFCNISVTQVTTNR